MNNMELKSGLSFFDKIRYKSNIEYYERQCVSNLSQAKWEIKNNRLTQEELDKDILWTFKDLNEKVAMNGMAVMIHKKWLEAFIRIHENTLIKLLNE